MISENNKYNTTQNHKKQKISNDVFHQQPTQTVIDTVKQ
jgi:hypothetical protein